MSGNLSNAAKALNSAKVYLVAAVDYDMFQPLLVTFDVEKAEEERRLYTEINNLPYYCRDAVRDDKRFLGWSCEFEIYELKVI